MRLAAALALVLSLAGCTQEGQVLGVGPGGFHADALGAGPYHTCAIQGGALSCWGRNDTHQLGTAGTTPVLAPAMLEGTDWAEVAAGEQHTCARRTGGSVWCWGENGSGQCGVGDTAAPVDAPAFVSTSGAAAQLSTNFDFTCAIYESGALFCWGANAEGQLAQDDPFPGDGVNRSAPVEVETAADWTFVDAGQGHACGIRAPGSLWCWGRNSEGELGLGAGAAGQLRTPQRVGDGEDWAEARAGQNHTCARKTDGSLWCWGANDESQLGLGDHQTRSEPTRVGDASDWTAVTVDTFHGCGLRAPGSLWCWGRNVEGQLGTGDHQEQGQPVQIGTDDDWSQVSAGRFHTCARKQDGTIFCVGQNTYGQLGTGDMQDHDTLVAAK